MKQFLMARGAAIVVKCARVTASEKVVVVTDSKAITAGEAVAVAAEERNAETTLVVMRMQRWDGEDPSAVVAAAMKAANVIITATWKEIGHSPGFRSAIQAGARGLVIGGHEDILVEGGVEADFEGERPFCDKVASCFTRASQVHLTTPAGTDLALSIMGRKGNSHPCIVEGPGQATGWPNIEANVAPVEGTAEGVIVFDASIPNLRTVTRGVLRDPLRLQVEKGFVVAVQGGYEARILDSLWKAQKDKSVYNIAQLSIGLNPCIREVNGIIANDHGVWGTVHIGIGTSSLLGGSTQAAGHIDGIMYKPTLLLDRETILRDGEVLVPR